MSDSENEGFGDSRPLRREVSTQSYVCETEALESQNLLSQEDMDRRGAGPGDTEADRRPLQEVNSIPILKRMNRIMDILVTEVKRLKEQVYNSNVNNSNVNNLRF